MLVISLENKINIKNMAQLRQNSTQKQEFMVSNPKHSLRIETKTPIYRRIWNVLTNPFLYIINGKIRY